MKIAIIGAGVAGLSAGCYLQMNGFDTEIFEMHSRPGGLCTNWKKGPYTFDGCIHWLLGSNETSPFFKLWSELFDMKSVRFINHDITMEIETLRTRDRKGNNTFCFYTNLDRFEKYMLGIAPEDEPMIRKFIRQIRTLQKFEIPPMIQSVPELLPWKEKARYIKYIPLLLFLNRYRKITNYSFARKLKNPFLKEVFQLLYDGTELPLLIHTIPLASFDRKGAAYPEGGSAAIVDKIEERYLSLGGILHFNSPVEKILVENNKAIGLQMKDGSNIAADFVISAADWRFTVFDALGARYVDRKILELGSLKKLKVYFSMFFVFLGLNRTFKDLPRIFRFPLDVPLVSPDGTKYDRMELHRHHYDPTMAPEGKTVVSVNLYTQNGDYWIGLRSADREAYKNTKERFAREIIDILEKKTGGIKDYIEDMSISTPATFSRYTNNWKGSIQGWLPGKNMIARTPVKPTLPGLQNFYIAGHWTIPGGGLPVAVKSARDAAMRVCHQTGKKFTIVPPATK